MGYAIDKWMAVWNMDSREVKVGPWPDVSGWSGRYDMSLGCCSSNRHRMSAEGQAMMLFIDFHSLVIGRGLDPQAVHREFLKIDEYRRRISPDIPGADP
jgi:hypothetical protein